MKKFKSRTAAILGLACVLALPATVIARKSDDSAVARQMNTLGVIIRELEQNYVDSIPIDKTFKTGIEAMLMTIDPYTEFYTPEERDEFSKMTTGEYGGIGSYIMERDGNAYISEPYADSPAARAGLRPGDKLLKVDDTDVRGLSSDKVTPLLRGKPNSTVRVTVQRPYVADSIQVIEVTRAKLHTPSVPYYGMVDDGVGYIRLTSFMEKSGQEVRAAIDSLRAGGNLQALVLDLRGNGGGLLESAVDIVGNFLPRGTEVLRTRGRNKEEERIYKTTHHPTLPDTPLAVLIDGGSASSSEITAGSIQDLDRGVLIGSRSYGKGLVQSTRNLPYDQLLKITVAKYYIPSGRLIQAVDYSHRNPDGTVARTPDSLTNVFKTRAGREVRDGGGLKPDVEVDWGKGNRLVYNLVRDHWIFDYANRYAATHPSVAAPEEFVVTDQMYEDFKNSIDPERFKYDKVCEEMMTQLRKAAEAEGYMNDETKAQFDTLATMLTHNLQSDLDLKRDEISQYLAQEILARYYYDRGRIIQELKDDDGLKAALRVLGDKQEYQKLLTPPSKTVAKNKSSK